jgi:hypothetical protein
MNVRHPIVIVLMLVATSQVVLVIVRALCFEHRGGNQQNSQTLTIPMSFINS